MQRIELPDGSIAEFPDYLSDDEIESVLQKEWESPGRKPIESKQSTWNSVAKPFKAQTFKTAEALNRGIGSFSQNLHELSEYVGTKTGMQPGGAFEKGAQMYLENAEYWRKKAEEINPTFVDEMIGEAIGGAVPGIAEFMLNVPYAAITEAKEAAKRGDSETFGGILGGAKRYVLGRIFHALGVLPKPVAAPAMGGVFATEAAASGGTPEEVAKSFGTGLLYGLSQKGRPRVRRIPRRIAKERKPKIEELERLVEFEPEYREVSAEQKLRATIERKKAPEEPKIAPRIEAKPQAIVSQINKEMPGNQVKYDGEWQIAPDQPVKHQFTPDTGPAKGATFLVDKLDLKSVKAKLALKIEQFKKPPKVERKIPFNDLPDRAKGAVASDARDKGQELEEFINSNWIAETVKISSLKAKNESVWTDKFIYRGAKTKGPLIVDTEGIVLDGNNRLREAIERKDTEIEILRKERILPKKPTPKKLPEKIITVARPKAIKKRRTRYLTNWIAETGGIRDVTLPGEIRDLITDIDKKGRLKRARGVPPGFLNKKGRGLDEIVDEARSAGFGVKDVDQLLELLEKDMKASIEGDVARRVTVLTDEAGLDKMWDDYLKEAREYDKASREEASELLSRKVTSKIKKEDEFNRLADEIVQEEYIKVSKEVKPTQVTLIEKEAPFELKGEEPPPKLIGPLGKKAVFPTEKVPAGTRGEQVSLIKRKGEQISIGEKIEEVGKRPPEILETFPGFQRMYEAVAQGREKKVRTAVEGIRKEYLTPVEGNPLDKGAVEFLKSEKYRDYIKEMPGIGELSPKEIFKYDPEAKKLIATIETKEGKLKPAIRQSGYHALKEFADSFEGAKDISKLSPSWTDPTRMVQEIDQGRFGGMAQKHILWPSRMTTLSKLKWQDFRKGELDALAERHNVKSAKKARAIGDVIEHIGTKDVRKSAEQLLQRPKINSFLKKFNPKAKTQIVEAAKELRLFWNNLLVAQNIPRRIRKQKEIPKRASYRPWIMETNLWSKLLGQKIRPEEIMEKPAMPDFIFPNQPFNPRAEARTGLMAKYPKERNIIRLMTDYIDTAGKDIFDTNVVHNNKIHAAVLRSKDLENAAEGINRWTAEVFAGVDPRLTRWAKETVPPKARKGILAIRRNLTRAVFPLNWTWNLFIQTSSAGITYARYGNKASAAGLKYFFSPIMRRSIKQNAYSYILKSRWGGKAHYQDVQKSISKNKRLEAKPIEKVEDFLNYLTSAFEDGLTGHAVAAAYHQGKTKLKLKGRELWEYASEGGAKTQSMYNYGDVPGMLRAREVGAIAPFQTFGFEVFNTVREMNVPGLRRIIGKTGVYETLSADSVAGKALMSNRLKMLARWVVAIAITDAVGEAAIGRKPWVVSSFIPFIGYILGGYAGRGPVPHQYMQDAKQGIKDVLVYGDFKRLRKWVMRYHVLAGVQLERMIEGIEAVSKGRVTDIRGRTLFRLEPEDYLKAITMGPYRTEPGKEYIRKRRESKSLLYQLGKKKKKKWRIVTKEGK